MRDNIVQRLRNHAETLGWLNQQNGTRTRLLDAANEIERLHVERDAERALANQLAVALAAQGSASFDEDTNRNIKRLALDAFKEARREQ